MTRASIDQAEVLRLAERVEALQRADNAVDVLVEIALFKPDDTHASVRSNSAGTKVIYFRRDGASDTFWANDWTLDFPERQRTAAALRALSTDMNDG